jgi:hypothetical protein
MVPPVRASDVPLEPPRNCAFSRWLWRQRNRHDSIGQLAHVVARDPQWRGGNRQEAIQHVRELGAKQAIQTLMGQAYSEYEASVQAAARGRVERGRAKRARRRQQRDARKRNR